jgi:hypothetical protein
MSVNVVQEQRNARRILAVCRVLNLQRKFLGFTLDLNRKGIKIIVNKQFPQQKEFEIILSQGRQYPKKYPDVCVTMEQTWRIPTGEDFDQIGGRIITVDSSSNLDNLIRYCEDVEKEKYNPD